MTVQDRRLMQTRLAVLVFNDYFRLLTAFLTLEKCASPPLGQQGAAHAG